jgi:hypothetical protein
MKQTAVEWLIEQLFGDNEIIGCSDELLEQAKEMEKEQIIQTWYDCKMSVIEKNPTTAEQYYNETFKQEQ